MYFDEKGNDITYKINDSYINKNKNKEEITIKVVDLSTSCEVNSKMTLLVSDYSSDCISQEEEKEYTIPKFFTPNADGINDIWEVTGTFFYNYTIYIYDRYGKLLKELQTNSGWDGNFNGRPMPSTDYWFQQVFENGKTYSGHFSLKR